MRYFRCKCGKRAAWSSMGVADCDVCPECHSTLGESPSSHPAPLAHDWREQWKAGDTDRPAQKERICLRCMTRHDITEANAHAVTVWVDGVPLWMESPVATGMSLKVARRVDPTFSLHSEDNPARLPIRDDEELTLTEGARFFSAPPAHV